MAEGEGAIQQVEQQQGSVENASIGGVAAGAMDPAQMRMMMQQMTMMAASGGLPQEMMLMMQMMQQMQQMQQSTGAAQQATTTGAAQQATTTAAQRAITTGAVQQATTTADWSKGGGKGGKGEKGGKGGKGGKGEGTPSDNLYIRGLPSPQVDSDMLIQLFTDLGLNVTRHKLIVDTKGSGTSAAMVQLASVEQAQLAMMQLNGQENFGGMLTMSFVESSGKGGKGGGDPALGGNSEYLVVVAKEHGNGDNLFVSGLPSPTVDRAELHKVFESIGFTVVRSKMLTDTRGKGHSSALVQLATREEASAAVEQLNGLRVEVLNLKAMELTDGQDPTMMPIHGNVFVGSIPKEFEEKELMEVFEQCGRIKSCKISRGWGGESKGSGFVRFETKEEAKFAIDCLNGFNDIVVKPAESDVKEGWDKGAGKGWFKGGKDGWGKDNWGKDNWGKDNWGKEAKVIPPPNRAAGKSQTSQDPNELEMMASFAGEDGEGSPSDTVFILGLPSPQVEEHQLWGAFIDLGMTPVEIETIPDDSDGQNSAAMVQFASVKAASDALAAVQGKKPSQLGLSAKGATNGAKGKKPLSLAQTSYGKGVSQGPTKLFIPKPY